MVRFLIFLDVYELQDLGVYVLRGLQISKGFEQNCNSYCLSGDKDFIFKFFVLGRL